MKSCFRNRQLAWIVFLPLIMLTPNYASGTTVSVGKTTVLGPFIGAGAKLAPSNVSPKRIRFYGTDLGWSYTFKGKVEFLFGDSIADERGDPIQPSTGGKWNDAFGSIDLAQWSDPSKISPHNIPRITIAEVPGTNQAAATNPGQPMGSFKTPVGGFTNGSRQFALFYPAKPLACRRDSDCGGGLSCEPGLGTFGAPWNSTVGATFACISGRPGCTSLSSAISKRSSGHSREGLCIDKTSSVWNHSASGSVAAVALKILVGIRSRRDPRNYKVFHVWLTNKFSNVAVRTVASFDPKYADDTVRQDYRPATSNGKKSRVFLWGRPGFVGDAAVGEPLGLYFAYVDMPANANSGWHVHYFAGLGRNGQPRFSSHQRDAVALDLNSTRPGVQSAEKYDVVNQMSISWVAPLKKWIMFYGGGMSTLPTKSLPACGVLQVFVPAHCRKVAVGNGAIHMRSANYPWGPWSPPQTVIIGGDPAHRPLEYQYAPGGVLYNPACHATACVSGQRTPGLPAKSYGFLYGADIIQQWTRPVGNGVDIIWNASTWDPYRVVLLRTRINRD